MLCTKTLAYLDGQGFPTMDIDYGQCTKTAPVGELVRLELTLPLGDVELLALVRQRSAFRYGFQFVEASSAQDIIGRTCRQLEVEQSVADRKQI